MRVHFSTVIRSKSDAERQPWLLYTSFNEDAIEKVTSRIQARDVAAKQAFIEVLVIETDVRNGLDFGLKCIGVSIQY